jgi:hypothetical protein
MHEQKTYEIKVRIAGMARAIAVGGVSALAAYEVADNTCAAWGRRLPDAVSGVERWTAELEEHGAYEFKSDEIQILVKRSA